MLHMGIYLTVNISNSLVMIHIFFDVLLLVLKEIKAWKKAKFM